jgi:acetylornithine deacetylase/succinyl-diaminopimelate desuccinylase-like protein
MSAWESYFDAHQARFLAELLDFLRIPSISSLPEHAADVQRAAEWVAARLRAAGLDHVQILPTGGHPVVYADWLHAAGKPTYMIYGHFDTQPVDPLHLWSHPPFEPYVADGKIFARGASDDKGNMLAPILAVEAMLKNGGLPVNLKFCFEGQEEIGSPQLPEFVAKQRELLACDAVISADGGQFSENEPAILLGLKGLAGIQIDVQGARTDLHSGMYGGVVQNPIHALVMILDSMRGKDGKILVAGFYDDVVALLPEDREQIAKVPYDVEDVQARLGVPAFFGEAGYTPLERAWARPTLEVNGIWGGFQGAGVKTVLPNQAHAKITCRLMANQDPQRIARLLVQHVEEHAPAGVHVTATPFDSGAYPYLMPADDPVNQAAVAVHRKLYGREPYYVRTGGSIPVCSLFLKELGVYTTNFAFGLEDEGAHAPDEFFRISSFERGRRAYCMLLEQLGA